LPGAILGLDMLWRPGLRLGPYSAPLTPYSWVGKGRERKRGTGEKREGKGKKEGGKGRG